jgi:hypothetical protein
LRRAIDSARAPHDARCAIAARVRARWRRAGAIATGARIATPMARKSFESHGPRCQRS